jgi:hypothetical protein
MGGPCVRHSWDGTTLDRQVFQARAQGVMTALPHAPSPRSVIANAQLSHEAKAPTLQALGLRSRIPHTMGVVSPVIMQALPWERWPWLDETSRDQGG